MANYEYCESKKIRGSNLYLIQCNNSQKIDAEKLKNQKKNKDVNLICGVDIDYLEHLRKEAGVFTPGLAKKLGISLQELRDYINYNKICPISFAENWELTIRSLEN